MPPIHIARNHASLGSFPEDQVRSGILSGRFTASDLAWREGMPEWRPLGEMAPQWGMELPPPDLPAEEGALPEVVPAESGPAWEDRETLGILTALGQTVSDVLFRPTMTFASMKKTGGLVNPLLYFVLVSSAMFAVSALYQMAMSRVNPALFTPKLPDAGGMAFPVIMIGSILISPALYVISAFLSSGITHLSLMALGAAKQPFETTFRVVCYAQASASAWNLIPFCGGLVGIIWGAYSIIIGLREAHGISGWKATLALTLPSLLCCGLLLVVGAAAGFGIAEMGRHGH
jgi:hypothetical protein